MRPSSLLPSLLVTACGMLTLAGCATPDAPSTLSLYCYRTLADVACYLAPDPGREGRIVAVTRVPLTPELELRRAAISSDAW